MRYLSVVEYCFADRPGGSGRVAWDVACAMRDRGHDVTLLVYRTDISRGEGADRLDGMRIIRFSKADRPMWHPGRLDSIVDSAASACRRWLADEEFDCVHVHTPLLGLGAARALGEGPRYVYTAHSPVVLEQEIQWRAQGAPGLLKLALGRRLLAGVERRVLMKSSAIHTLSAFTRARLDEAYGVGDRITVIPHWYSPRTPPPDRLTARRVLGWDPEQPALLTVRGLGPRYGVDLAIAAIAPLLESHNAVFYVGGEGPWRSRLEKMAQDAGAGDRIRFLGRLSDSELEAAYAAADLFILPTLALECFGLILIEAMAFGCPVLSSDAAAIPEIMQQVLPDWVVPAGDVAALRARADDFLAGRLRPPSRQALQAFVCDRYGESRVAPQIVKLCEGPPPRAVAGS